MNNPSETIDAVKAGSGAHLYALYEGISLVPRTLHQELFEALCSLLRQSSQDHIRGKRIAIARLSLQTMSRLLHLPYDSRQISRMIVNSWRDCLRWLSLLIDRLSDASELEEAVLSPFFMLATSLQASNNDGYLREKMARKIAARLWLYAGFQLKKTTMASKLLFWTLSEPPTNPEYDVLLEVCAHAEIIAERSQSLLKAASSSRERLIIAGDTEPLVISHLFLFRALVYVYRFALALKHRKALVTLVLVIRKVLGEKTRFEETPTLGVSKAFAALRLLFVLPPKVDVAIKPGLLQAIDCANSATFYNREYDYEDNIRSNIQTIMENLTLRVGCTPSTASIAMESVLDLQSAGRLCDEVKSGPRRIIGWQNFETALTVSTSFLKCSYKDNIEILYEECDNIRCCRSFSAVRLFRCSACGVVAYCSKECQRYSWTSLDHKSVCKALDFFRRITCLSKRTYKFLHLVLTTDLQMRGRKFIDQHMANEPELNYENAVLSRNFSDFPPGYLLTTIQGVLDQPFKQSDSDIKKALHVLVNAITKKRTKAMLMFVNLPNAPSTKTTSTCYFLVKPGATFTGGVGSGIKDRGMLLIRSPGAI